MAATDNFNFSQKLLFHPEFIQKLAQGERPFPITLELCLTEKCNQNCKFCFYFKGDSDKKRRTPQSLETLTLKESIKQAADLGTKGIVLTGGGEPMLHKDFYTILGAIKDSKIDCGLITNGSVINEKNLQELHDKLRWIRISMGGVNSEIYEDVQGVSHFERVMENIKMLQSYKTNNCTSPDIGIRLMVGEGNIKNLASFAKIVKDYNINYIQLGNDQFNLKYCLEILEYNKDILEEAAKVLEEGNIKLLYDGYSKYQNQDIKEVNRCYGHNCISSVGPNGDFYFCKNTITDKNFCIGNIYKNTLEEIWNGEENIRIEETLIPMECKHFCKSKGVVITLYNVCNPPSDLSINFIS